MADGIDRIVKDKKSASFEGIALSVSIIAVAFVASADMLDYMTKTHNAVEIVASHRAAPSRIGGGDLDETPTGSLPKMISRSVLDPCTGAVR